MTSVDITPPANVYATFGRLNYTPWHAIAEFVDNSTQSFFAHRERLISLARGGPTLRVDIVHRGSELVITDNAMGMALDELTRALQLNTPPPDTSGRSEFGMGLKTAACWFGKWWSVSTTRHGDPNRYVVVFDVDAVASSGARSIEIVRQDAPASAHGTTLTIGRLARPVAGRQVDKTKRLLASIYRRDLVSGDVEITWNGSFLTYEDSVLFERDTDGGGPRPARVDIDVVVIDPVTHTKHEVRGWVGALLKMSAVESGVSFLRRGRMITGGVGGGWKPVELVGSMNSHSGKRLIGELEVDSFPVNFTKDGFAWDGGLEDELIDVLRPLVADLRAFADNARVREDTRTEPADFVRAVDEVQKGVDNPVYREAVSGAMKPGVHTVSPASLGDRVVQSSREVPQHLTVPLADRELLASLSLVEGGPQEDWLVVVADPEDEYAVDVRLNTGNRFVRMHLDNERERTLVAKFALAVAVAEQQARIVWGDDVPPEELREYLSLCLGHSVSE